MDRLKKILITGDEGFIGLYLKKYLETLDFEIIGLDIKSGKDILNCEFPECDYVIHLAGLAGVLESLEDPRKYWEVNVEGTKRVLNHYKDVRVLVAGSSSQYEPHLNPYAASKCVIESIPHPDVVFMRFHTVYSNESRSGMFFDKLLTGNLEYVTNHERDFIHVDDLCRAIYIILNSTFKGPIDIGTGKAIKVSTIRPDLPVKLDTPGERLATLANVENMEKLGFVPKIKVEDFLLEHDIIVRNN